MGMTMVEKILALHSKYESVKAGDIVDVFMDVRAARDFGGANVVKNIEDYGLSISDAARTFFTFDCNPTGSDQKYAVNQQLCRQFARKNAIKVYDIDNGIGTHTLIHEGLVYPGATAVTTDSHANILGAVGAFGQGMGDQDIAAAWSQGSIWFKVPESVKIILKGKRPDDISAKDIVLNLLNRFGANTLLGYAVELYGEETEKFSLDERITLASMATEMGAIILLFPPNEEVLTYCRNKSGKAVEAVLADPDAQYKTIDELDFTHFTQRVSLPGKPHDTAELSGLSKTRIDSAFIGSCTNGRMEDLRAAAAVLKGEKVADGVVLKIVPATDEVWQQALKEGLVEIFKNAGALLSNAGCAGCAAGQVGQNGLGEVSISTGNRNFPGKQGKGEVYLASPAVVAASAVAGFIVDKKNMPGKAEIRVVDELETSSTTPHKKAEKAITEAPSEISGRVWLVDEDNIDTDMIFHNRYLTITDIKEMGQYTFDNLKGFEDFAQKVQKGDIVISGKNFGCGSSRQQAVDCFKSLGIQAILAQSFGAIYERNAINAAFPVLTYESLAPIAVQNGDALVINFVSGKLTNTRNGKRMNIEPFSEVQEEIYQRGGLF